MEDNDYPLTGKSGVNAGFIGRVQLQKRERNLLLSAQTANLRISQLAKSGARDISCLKKERARDSKWGFDPGVP